MAVCVVLTQSDVQNLVLAELWLEKWDLLQDTRMPLVAQGSPGFPAVFSSGFNALPFQLSESAPTSQPAIQASLSNLSLLYSLDNTPNSADWELGSRLSMGDLSMLSFGLSPGMPLDSLPGTPVPIFSKEQSREGRGLEEQGYTLTGYTTLESPREREGEGEGEREREREKRANSSLAKIEGGEDEEMEVEIDRKVQEQSEAWTTSHMGM